MTRPLGRNIIEVCELLDYSGPATSKWVGAEIEFMGSEQARQYCLRAMGHGLLTMSETTPPIYSVRPDWRARAAVIGVSEAKPVVRKPKQLVKPVPTKKVGASLRNSVFDSRDYA